MLKKKQDADSSPEDIKGQEVALETLQRKAIIKGDILLASKWVMVTRSPKASEQ